MGVPRGPDMGQISLVKGIAFLLWHQQGRGHPTELQGARHPQEVIPPVEHALSLDPAGDIRLEAGIALDVDRTRCKQAAVADVSQPRGEAVAQEVEESKD